MDTTIIAQASELSEITPHTGRECGGERQRDREREREIAFEEGDGGQKTLKSGRWHVLTPSKIEQ